MMSKESWAVLVCWNNGRAIGVVSDSFAHDVRLTVDGDFESAEQKKEYCEELAEKLNTHTPLQGE